MANGKSYTIDFDGEKLMNSLSMRALHVAVSVVGALLIVVGIGLNVARLFYVKKISKRRQEEMLRFRDDAIIEPRMCVKVAEIGLKEQMHWKEYFTRDAKPFDYPPKETNQSSVRS
uniref:Uncharacterized protein n=1 Tax=Steinernema glaseri TaxID=37863 RepID=A0A1I8AG92_9BILA